MAPGPVSSIGRVFPFCASKLSLNTGGASFAPAADKTCNPDFSENRISYIQKTRVARTANFSSLDWAKGTHSPNKLVL